MFHRLTESGQPGSSIVVDFWSLTPQIRVRSGYKISYSVSFDKTKLSRVDQGRKFGSKKL